MSNTPEMKILKENFFKYLKENVKETEDYDRLKGLFISTSGDDFAVVPDNMSTIDDLIKYIKEKKNNPRIYSIMVKDGSKNLTLNWDKMLKNHKTTEKLKELFDSMVEIFKDKFDKSNDTERSTYAGVDSKMANAMGESKTTKKKNVNKTTPKAKK